MLETTANMGICHPLFRKKLKKNVIAVEFKDFRILEGRSFKKIT